MSAQPAKRVAVSPGVNETGAETLVKRGNLSREEIHKLAHKGKRAVCHSDRIKDASEAKMVQINTLKAHGVTANDGII